MNIFPQTITYLRKLVNHAAVYRTAPATPDLLEIYIVTLQGKISDTPFDQNFLHHWEVGFPRGHNGGGHIDSMTELRFGENAGKDPEKFLI